MTVIDLNAEKYRNNEVVVKCGDKEFVAVADDKTLDRIMSASKKQLADGIKAQNKINQIDFDKLDDSNIDQAVESAVDTITVAKEDYIQLADNIFGKGAGQAIYNALSHSTIAMNNVLQEVADELYKKKSQAKAKAKAKYKRKRR